MDQGGITALPGSLNDIISPAFDRRYKCTALYRRFIVMGDIDYAQIQNKALQL